MSELLLRITIINNYCNWNYVAQSHFKIKDVYIEQKSNFVSFLL